MNQQVSLNQTRQSATKVITYLTVEQVPYDPLELENSLTGYGPEWIDCNLNVPNSTDFDLENIVDALESVEHTVLFEMAQRTSSWSNRNQEHSEPQNQILPISNDAFQCGDNALRSSEETVSQNGISSASKEHHNGSSDEAKEEAYQVDGKGSFITKLQQRFFRTI